MITWDYYEALAELLRHLGSEPAPAISTPIRERPDPRRRGRDLIMKTVGIKSQIDHHAAPEGIAARWALVGSAACAVQDMTVEVNDVDALIRNSDFLRARTAFAEFNPTEPVEAVKNGGGKIQEFGFEIAGVKVHCFTAPDDDPYVQKLKEYGTRSVYLSTLKIPCLPIEAQLEAYQLTGQEDKAKAIEAYFEEMEKKKEQERRKK